MKVGEQLREIWRQATAARRDSAKRGLDAADAEAERKTLALPAIMSPVQFPGRHRAQADAGESAAVCRDAGGAAGDQRDQGPHRGDGLAGAGAARCAAGDVADAERKLRALRRTLEEPNAADSFRTLIEQVIEDALTGGFGAIEMEADRRSGAAGDAVGRGRRIDPHQSRSWDGQPDSPRYAQAVPGKWSRARWNSATTS